MSETKEALLDWIRHEIRHSSELSVSNVAVKDGDGARDVVFNLVECNKYDLRDSLIAEFSIEHEGHEFELVINDFVTGRVTAVLVDTTIFADRVDAFVREIEQGDAHYLEDYDSLTLTHVEALEQWGVLNERGVARLHELEAKHFHDAFLDYYRLVDEADVKEKSLLRQTTQQT